MKRGVSLIVSSVKGEKLLRLELAPDMVLSSMEVPHDLRGGFTVELVEWPVASQETFERRRLPWERI